MTHCFSNSSMISFFQEVIMRKILLFVALFFIPLFVSAATYTVGDITQKYDDSKWMVFTRENVKLKELGVDDSYLLSLFEQQSIYLDALTSDAAIESFVFIKDVDSNNNLHKYSNSEIKELENEVIKGLNTTKHGIYETGGYKYVYMSYKDSGLNIYDYYTVINGKGYTLKFQKKTDFSSSELSLIKGIVDNSTFKLDSKYEKTPSKGILYNAIKYGIIAAVIAGVAAAITVTAKKKNNQNQQPTQFVQNPESNAGPNPPDNQNSQF